MKKWLRCLFGFIIIPAMTFAWPHEAIIIGEPTNTNFAVFNEGALVDGGASVANLATTGSLALVEANLSSVSNTADSAYSTATNNTAVKADADAGNITADPWRTALELSAGVTNLGTAATADLSSTIESNETAAATSKAVYDEQQARIGADGLKVDVTDGVATNLTINTLKIVTASNAVPYIATKGYVYTNGAWVGTVTFTAE